MRAGKDRLPGRRPSHRQEAGAYLPPRPSISHKRSITVMIATIAARHARPNSVCTMTLRFMLDPSLEDQPAELDFRDPDENGPVVRPADWPIGQFIGSMSRKIEIELQQCSHPKRATAMVGKVVARFRMHEDG